MIAADVSLFQAITLFSVGFLGAIIGGITSIFKGSSTKKAAKIAAANAAKQRAHDLKMAQMAASQQAASRKNMMNIAMIGGGLALVAVIFLKRGKK